MDPLAIHRNNLYNRLSGKYEDMSDEERAYLRDIIRRHPLTQMAMQSGYKEAMVLQAMERLFQDGTARLHMVEQDDKVLVSIVPTRLH